jgi:hypothetical protein
VADKLADMAAQLGGRVRRGLDGPLLDLLPEDDPAVALSRRAGP